MNNRSQALEFQKVKMYIEKGNDAMDLNRKNIRSLKELRDVLNEMDLEENEPVMYITGETEDKHMAHFRFYHRLNKESLWHWGYVQFMLDKIDSQAERLLKQVRELLS